MKTMKKIVSGVFGATDVTLEALKRANNNAEAFVVCKLDKEETKESVIAKRKIDTEKKLQSVSDAKARFMEAFNKKMAEAKASKEVEVETKED